MTQAFTVISGDTPVSTGGISAIPDNFATLLTKFSGGTAPSTTFAFQWWYDTSTGLLKIRNSTNSAWVVVGLSATIFELGALSASRNLYLTTSPRTHYVMGCVVVSDTATTGSGAGNRWDFQIRNKTAAVNLLIAAKTTNGAEIAVDTPYAVTADQNQQPAALAVLELQITKTGSPTSPLARVSVEFLTAFQVTG